jgi:hypothetical protein
MKFGHRVPGAVAEILTRFGFRTEVVPITSREGRTLRIDLRVWPLDPLQRPWEVQMTLRPFVEGKIAHWMAAALGRKDRGPGLYLEIRDRAKRPLHELTGKIAKAIREVIERFKAFEDGNLLGVRLWLSHQKSRLERFSLFDFAGKRLAKILAALPKPKVEIPKRVPICLWPQPRTFFIQQRCPSPPPHLRRIVRPIFQPAARRAA